MDLPQRLAREGVPAAGYSSKALSEVLEAVSSGMAAKEAVPSILALVGREEVPVDDAIGALNLGALDEAGVANLIDALVAKEGQLIREKGESAFSHLMGEAMKELRGKADGAEVARILKEKLGRALGT